MTAVILYGLTIVLFIVSLLKDKSKTKNASIKAFKSFENIMPQFLSIIIIVGFILSVLDTNTISKLIGSESGVFGVILSAIVGSVTLMPTFVAFSTANSLLLNGAGYSQIAALVSTLTLVGIVTIPLESKYIGKKAAYLRNFLAFLFSFVVAYFMGVFLG